jgi:hypothetical protein
MLMGRICMAPLEVSTSQLEARATRFSPIENAKVPPPPKKSVPWSGGKLTSNKEEVFFKVTHYLLLAF